MTILIVRHGETDGNTGRILQRPDVPLNTRGIRQAHALAERLSAHGFVHILCSDLERARMTAAPIAARSSGGRSKTHALAQQHGRANGGGSYQINLLPRRSR